MRLLVLVALLIAFSGAAPVPAAQDDDGALKGTVTESSLKRLPRPAAAVGHPAPAAAGASTLKAAVDLDSAAFDLDAHRTQIDAGITVGVVPGWIQAVPTPEQVQERIDKFFAPLYQSRLHPIARHDSRLPAGLQVFVRMGLCGMWDAQGDGRRRWAVLAKEMYSGGPLSESWQRWQKEASAMVKANADELLKSYGVAAVHVVVLPDGRFDQIMPYDGAERPFRQVLPSESGQAELMKILRNMACLPPFPAGSQAQECHILVFVSNNN